MEGELRDDEFVQSVGAGLSALLPEAEHLPQSHRRKWLYYKLFPCVAFDIYPDQVDFMQWLPVIGDDQRDPRDQLCAARRPAGDEGGALS